jgi:hypothetical protein
MMICATWDETRRAGPDQQPGVAQELEPHRRGGLVSAFVHLRKDTLT